MDLFLDIAGIVVDALVFAGPLLLVIYYLRARLGLAGRQNPFGAPDPRPSGWFVPKVIVTVWVIALALMFILKWQKSEREGRRADARSAWPGQVFQDPRDQDHHDPQEDV